MRDAVRLNAAVGIAVLVLLPMRTVHAYDVRTHGSVAGESFDASKALQRYLRDVGLRLDARFDPQAASPPGKLAEFVNVGTARDWMIEGVIR
ncbi:MAG: hypothetical protein DMD81_10400 [Candidatus Rokuibacteriota bacterium]|nr:MAG: hypothetical protein DMD81_10400 [Candidatus Rokubacteria bacterium]